MRNVRVSEQSAVILFMSPMHVLHTHRSKKQRGRVFVTCIYAVNGTIMATAVAASTADTMPPHSSGCEWRRVVSPESELHFLRRYLSRSDPVANPPSGTS